MSETRKPWMLAVGQPFAPERQKWPDGSFEYRYFDGNHLLQICVASPSEQDTAVFLNGRMHVGLYAEQGVVFFLFRIEGFMEWSDQAFSIRLVGEADRGLPRIEDNERLLLTLVLVDADTGLVSAMRMVTYSPHFSRLFVRKLQAQLDAPVFDRSEHFATVEEIYKQFPTSKAMAKAALVIERAGSRL